MKISTLSLAAGFLASVAEAASFGPYPYNFVDSRSLQRRIDKKHLLQKAKYLQKIADRNNGTRKWGSPGHWETLDWIYKTVKRTGYYDVKYQYFNISEWTYDSTTLDLSDGTKPTILAAFLPGYNAETAGALAAVSNLGCDAADFASVSGKVALISRGNCTFAIKNANAKNAGATGIIVYNDDREAPLPNPDLGDPKDVNLTSFLPGVFIDKPTGVSLVQKLPSGAITAKIAHKGHATDRLTANILAESKCGNHNQVITTGAHTDSVEAGPGINDDGSGTISQLEVALALTKYKLKNAVRWGWWSAEEDGLLGSTYYTQHISEAEKAKIVLNLDFDMLASNNFVYSVYDGDGSTFGKDVSGPEGSGHVEQTFIDFYKAKGLASVPTAFDGRSDYVGFTDIGIPAGGIAAGAEGIKTEEEQKLFGGVAGQPYDKCYHAACDRVDNLNMTAWEVNTKCVADSIARYAMSIKGMPFPRKPEVKKAMALMSFGATAPKPKTGKNSGKKYINSKGSMIPNNRKRKAVVTY